MTQEQKIEALKSLTKMKSTLLTMPDVVQQAVRMCQQDLERACINYNLIEGGRIVSTFALTMTALEVTLLNEVVEDCLPGVVKH